MPQDSDPIVVTGNPTPPPPPVVVGRTKISYAELARLLSDVTPDGRKDYPNYVATTYYKSKAQSDPNSQVSLYRISAGTLTYQGKDYRIPSFSFINYRGDGQTDVERQMTLFFYAVEKNVNIPGLSDILSKYDKMVDSQFNHMVSIGVYRDDENGKGGDASGNAIVPYAGGQRASGSRSDGEIEVYVVNPTGKNTLELAEVTQHEFGHAFGGHSELAGAAAPSWNNVFVDVDAAMVRRDAVYDFGRQTISVARDIAKYIKSTTSSDKYEFNGKEFDAADYARLDPEKYFDARIPTIREPYYNAWILGQKSLVASWMAGATLFPSDWDAAKRLAAIRELEANGFLKARNSGPKDADGNPLTGAELERYLLDPRNWKAGNKGIEDLDKNGQTFSVGENHAIVVVPDASSPLEVLEDFFREFGRGVDEGIDRIIDLDGGEIGRALGSTLGRRLTQDPAGQVVASATLSTALGAIGEFIDEKILGGTSSTDLLGHGLDHLGQDILNNIVQGGIGALSSYIMAELFDALDIGGLGGELGQSVGSQAIATIASNLLNLGKPIAAGSDEVVKLFTGVNPALVVSAAGNLLGTKLAAEIKTFKSVGGQIGTQVGAITGAIDAGPLLAYAASTGNVAVFAAAVVVVALDTLLGGLIGSIFGGTPRSGADATWDDQAQAFAVANSYARKGGSKETAEGLAQSVASELNQLLNISQSQLLNPHVVEAGNYGTRSDELVYRPYSTQDKSAITARFRGNEALGIINFGLYAAIDSMIGQMASGDVYVKRAIDAHLDLLKSTAGNGAAKQFSVDSLHGDIVVATDFGRYVENQILVQVGIANNPDGAQAAGWMLTLARAHELGLNKRNATDWTGGYAAFIESLSQSLGVNKEEVLAGMVHGVGDDNMRLWITDRNGEIGGFAIDSIEASSISLLKGSIQDDVISIEFNSKNSIGIQVRGGAGRVVASHNVTVDATETQADGLIIDTTTVVYAGAGNDIVHAGDLGNTIFGEVGNDSLYGGRLDDWLFGGEGNDRLDAGAQNGGLGGDGNYLDGGTGDDQLFGREGSDWLEGGEGVDILRAGDGGDILSGGGGDGDELYGGSGDDTYLLRRGDGADLADDLDARAPTASAVSNPGSFPGLDLSDPIAARFAAIRSGSLKRDWLGTSAAVSAGQTAGGEDSIAFGYGISLSDVRLSRSADSKDLIVELTEIDDSGTEVLTGDKLTVRDWFTDPFKRVEWMKFVDGTEIRIGDVTSFIIGTGGDDVLIGTAGNDFVYGGAGNDKLYTLGGNDIGLGGSGDDLVSGGSGNDIVVGGLGNDNVIGGSGNDAVSGDAGDDTLYGSQGNDILSGGRGDDVVVGGAGNDTFRFSRGDGNDVVFDDYSDTWTVIWKAGNWLNGYSYNATTSEVLDANGNAVRKNFGTVEEPDLRWTGEFDFDDTTGQLRQFTPPLGAATTVSDKGEDRIEFALDINVQDIMFERVGNSGDLRVVVGRDNAETSLASARDSITLKDWYDNPGAIETFAFYGAGEINVAAGGYNLIGGTDGAEGNANAPLSGTSGKDWMTGAGGDDFLAGGAGDDIVAGNAGSDTLKGEAGDDVLYGGSGNDVLNGGLGRDVLSGGAGSDTASYISSASGVTVSLADSGKNTGEATGDVFDSIENLIGSGAADDLSGDEGDNELTGGKGDDVLRGGRGNDTYVWNIGDGSDRIEEAFSSTDVIVDADGNLLGGYEAQWELIAPGSGKNQKNARYLLTVANDAGNLVYSYEIRQDGNANPQPGLSAWPANGWLGGFARNSDNSVSRTTIDTTIDAGDADALEMGAGISLADLVFERAGNDLKVIYLEDAPGNGKGKAKGHSTDSTLTIANHFTVGGRVEFLVFADGLAVSLANVLVAGNSGIVNGTDLDELIVGQWGVRDDVLTGGAGSDVLSGGEGNDTLRGGIGDDILEGGAGADILDGGANSSGAAQGAADSVRHGDTVRYASSSAGVTVDLASSGPQSGGDAQGDTLSNIENVTGSAFDDTLRGDDGANILDALGGNNIIYGRGGDDVLIAGDGNDTLDGGDGEDNISAGGGSDVLRGGAGNDVLAGLDGDDQLFGDDGNDILSAGRGNDILEGGVGDDQLIAGEGNDTLRGGAGNDMLAGEAGNDSLAGGAGADTYYFAAGFGQDVLTDSEGANEIVIDQSISYDALWFNRSGNDLMMTVRGSADRLTISDFYAPANTASIYSVQTATHRLFLGHPELRNFLDAMQAIAPNGVPTSIPAPVAALMSRYWHEGTTARPYAEDFELAIDEDTGTGAIAIGAIDHDENIARYEISGDARFGAATIDAVGRFAYTPDLNFNGSDSFRVVIVDGDNNAREIEVRVGIAAVDDAPVIDGTANGLPLAINENALLSDTETGSVVGRILGSEFDGEAIVFTLTDDADGRFVISADGVVSVGDAARLDHESADAHTITVRVTDAVGSIDERSFTIAIGDVNEENALPAAYGWTVAENTDLGAVVGQVVATDPDTAGEAFADQRYAFEYDEGIHALSADGRYAIDALTGAVTIAAPGDFEGLEPTRDYVVIARDNGGEAGFTESRTTLTIAMTDVNELNRFAGNVAFELAENEAAGKLVGVVGADDEDTAGIQFAAQRYYFWDGTDAAATSGDGRFAIDSETGAITATASFDFESDVRQAEYTVVARDNAAQAAYFSAYQTVGIALTNVNEMPEVPALLSAALFIGEGALAGQVVARFALADPDGTIPTLVADSNPGNLFSIVGGELRLAAAVDFETLAGYGYAIGDADGDGRADITVSLALHASDGELRSADADSLTFHVEDTNEAPSALLTTGLAASFAERDRVPSGTTLPAITLAILSVIDPDLSGQANATYTYTVDDARFEVVGSQLRLKEGVAFDFENEAQVTVNVTATDISVDPLSVSRALAFAVENVDDYLEGTPLADTLIGQANRDIITGLSGDDRIEGLSGDDLLSGDDGADTIFGGAGADRIDGGADDDSLFGDAGSDTIFAGSGHDTISGGADADWIDGGEGDDHILGDDDYAADTIDGGAGTDRLVYSALSRGVVADLSIGMADGDLVTNVEEIEGSAFADALTGDAGDNRLIGGAGADILVGLGGSDRLEGGSGNDTLSGGEGNDLLFGEAGDDTLTGDAGSDSLFGGEGTDTLLGGSGDDRLEGGFGNDTLDAGDGNDTYIVDRRSNHDTIFNYDQSGDDIDVLGFNDTFGEISEHDLWFERQGDDLVVFIIGEDSSVRVTDWYVQVDAEGRANHRLDFLLGGEWVSRDTDVEGLAEFQSNFARPNSLSELQALLADPVYDATVATFYGINAPPEITGIADQRILEDGRMELILTLADDYTPSAGIMLSGAVLSGAELLGPQGLVVGAVGADGRVSVVLDPAQHAAGTIELALTALDAGGIEKRQTLRLVIDPVADTPVITQLSATPATSGAAIALSLAVEFPDRDGSETQTIRIAGIPGGVTLTKGVLDGASGEWVLAPADLAGLAILAPAGWAQDLSLSVTAFASEGGTNAQSAAATATVVINAGPTDIASGLLVPENTANGSAIGYLQGVDPDGDALVYQLLDGADGRFALDADGLLRVADGAKLDFEIAATHAIRVRVTDPFGESFERSLTVGVTNVNEANSLPPAHNFTVDEDRGVGTIVGSIAASDPDTAGTPFAEQRYAFRNGANLSQVSADGLFAIDAISGAISVAVALDHEAQASAVYTVVARDNAGGAGGNEAVSNVSIAIGDVNEANSLPASIALSVAENQGIGASVGFVSSNDPDAAGEAFGEQRYYFLLGDTASATSGDGRYAINAISGEITTARVLDRESADASTSHIVIARDNRGAAGYTQAQSTVTVGVSNVNEAPVISGDTSRAVFSEPVPGGTLVASFAASDPDGTTPVLQFVGGSDLFVVSGLDVFLKGGAPSSYAEALAYANAHGISAGDIDGDGRADVKLGTVEIVASDGALQSGVLRKDIYIENVAQAPNAPGVLINNLYSETGDGLTPHAGKVVATFGLSDPDGATPALVITGGNDNGWFQVAGNSIVFTPGVDLTADYLRSIVGTRGVAATFASDIDADGLKELLVANLTLAARDADGLWSDATGLAVRIEDRNEGPRFGLVSYNFNLAETVAAYAQVGAVTASDIDGPASELIFGFAGGTSRFDGQLGITVGVSADGRLLVDGRTGQIYTANSGSYASSGGQNFDYAVTATDRNGDAYALTTNSFLRVGVTAVNEPHSLHNASGSQAEVEGLGPLIPIFDLRSAMLEDPEGQNMRWQFQGGGTVSGDGLWTITSDGTLVLTNGRADYEEIVTYTRTRIVFDPRTGEDREIVETFRDPSRATQALSVEAIDDSIGVVASAIFTATITDEPEAPVLLSTARVGKGSGEVVKLGTTLFAIEGDTTKGDIITVRFDDPDTLGTGDSLTYRIDNLVKTKYNVTAGGHSGMDHHDPTISVNYTTGTIGFQVDNDGEWEGGIITSNGRETLDYHYDFDLIVRDASGSESATHFTIIFGRDGKNFGPVVLDLDGDGLEFVSIYASSVYKDLDGDGVGDHTGWVAADDGILVLDRDGSGSIDNPDEMTFIGDYAGAQSDMEGLRGFDTNGDGVLDSNDTRYTDLQVWRDLDQNGISDAGELFSLSALGIASISLTTELTGAKLGDWKDNGVFAIGAYTLSDGSQGIAGDSWLYYEPSYDFDLAPPVILDFNGNGETLVGLDKSTTIFDQDGDGNRERTAWFERGDAVLAVDRNQNGLIDDISEISFLQEIAGAKTDLEGLAAYDSDKNGVIDSSDIDFAALKLWFDRDSDGVTDAGELVSLSEASVASISLEATSDETTGRQADGSMIYGKATFRFDDGRQGAVFDTGLAYLANTTTHATAIAGATAAGIEFSPASDRFDRKAKKFYVYSSGGELALSLRKPKGNQDPRAGVMGSVVEMRFTDRAYGYLDAIVLDLDRDGIETKRFSKNQALFDMNGDGVADDTGWTTSNDGFLVVDRNANGKIDNGSELSFQLDIPEARSAIEGLAAFDSNNDGLVSILDQRFGELKVWVDLDHDGVSNAGELRSLSDQGIVSISLRAAANSDQQKLGYNVLLSTAVFNRTDGSSGTLGDVAFGYIPSHKPAAAADLPASFLRDYGLDNSSSRLRDLSLPEILREDFWSRYDDGIPVREPSGYVPGRLVSDASWNASTTPSAVNEASFPNAATGAFPLAADAESTDGPRARMLAMMLQDMAAFGAKGMLEDQLLDRRLPYAISDFYS